MEQTNGIADDLLRNGFERWQRLEGEKQAISDDLKELFAELKGQGFDGKALRAAFRQVEKAGDASVEEHNAIVDLYVGSLMAPRPGVVGTVPATHTHAAREASDPLAALRSNKDLAIVEAANLQPKSENQLPQPAGGDLAVTPSPSHDGQVATIPAVVEGQRSTLVIDVGDSGEALSSVDNEESLRDETPAGQGAAARRDEAEETVKSAEVQASAAPASKYAAPGVVVWEHTPPEPVKRHPYSAAFGEMGQDLAVIDDDIAGAKSEPIVRVGNEILDGWARYCTARGMIGGSGLSTEYPVKQYDGDNALVDCIRWNVTGRIMTDKQLQLAAKRLIEIEPKRKAEILATFEALA